MRPTSIVLLLLLTSSFAQAQTAASSASPSVAPSPTPAQSSSALPITLNYGSAEWNKNSEKIDSAVVFIHDKKSDKIAKVLLEETAPDSSIFQGQFSLSWSGEAAQPEVFIPPQKMRDDPKAVSRFQTMLKDGHIKPQPLLVRQEKNNVVYDVFDTKDQLDRAQKVYAEEKAAETKINNTKLVKTQASDQQLQLAKATAQQEMMAKMAKEAAAKEADRIRQEQLEQQRIDEKKKELEHMAAAEKKKRQQQAEQFAKEGNAYYAASDFANAEKAYKQATELDPQNKSYYFQYGVSQYRLEKLNDAMVTLDIVKDPATDLERKYFLGLIHYKLKEYTQAKAAFGEVRNSKDPTLAPSAAFYQGIIDYAEENYKPSQESFEFVIDNSKDPALDKRAEEYINMIAAQVAAKKFAAKKWIIDATVGIAYDSNILYQPNLNQQAPSNMGGMRVLTNADVERRLFFTDKNDMSLKFSGLYYWSFDSKFSQGDPTELTLIAPYSHKGMVNGKSYKLTLTPGYDTIMIDYTGDGVRQDLVNSATGDVDYTLVMNDHWFSDYILNIRYDGYQIPDEIGVNNESAMKWTLKKQETTFLDPAKKYMLLGYLDYVDNMSVGSYYAYTKWDLGVTYGAPIEKYKNLTWTATLATYLQSYTNFINSGSRHDTDVSLNVTVNKIMSDRWTWSSSAMYQNNASNNSSYAYDKYTIGTSITFNWDDAPKDVN